ncbi:MAG TPA: zf-HC2 domain-containing protein [Burkholderiales bacterium]|jgi:anti-sigma factor (TIGR02949 family)|nr:zf-HC2 domain-containing protein [Burkholderiales bacterium]
MSPEARSISCEEALKRLYEHLDRALDATEAAEIEHHLETCRACFSRAEFEKRLKERLAAIGREQAPEALQRRVRELLRRF